MLKNNLQQYVVQAQQLSQRLESDPAALQELLHLIECRKDETRESPELSEFFKGEYAFYSGQHEVALKHYLEAKGIEHLQFYCYRSSSHIYKKQGEAAKALVYAKKALEIFPEDTAMLSLHDALNRENPSFSPLLSPQPVAMEETQAPASHLPKPSFVLPSDESCQRLEAAIDEQSLFQSRQIQDYLEYFKNRGTHPDHCLYALHGWKEAPFSIDSKMPALAMVTEEARKSTGGFLLRWNGKGIAINPGKHFVDYFHAMGHSIQEIDFVIATHEETESCSDIRKIYDLTYQLNRAGKQLHVVHYYLNPKAYQELSGWLKPHFKQERHSIHCLELFLDSSDIEKVDLGSGIRLHYFPAGMPAVMPLGLSRDKAASMSTALGIRFELFDDPESMGEEALPRLKLGYASGVSWSPLLGHHLSHCSLLVAGLGNTNSVDYSRASYLDKELGYFGTFSLLEELMPKLLLCSEFGGREGDIRLEVVRKLKNDLYQNFLKNDTETDSDISEEALVPKPAILPADIGLYIDLKTLKIRCSETGSLVDPSKIKAVRSHGRFSRLLYLSDTCCLD
jgi:tetratricopeptide (TPR) repeat protein